MNLGELVARNARTFLQARIAVYKIPRLLEIAAALPRNVSGKVLKYQLRKTYTAAP